MAESSQPTVPSQPGGPVPGAGTVGAGSVLTRVLRAVEPDPERRFSRAGHMVKMLQGEAPSMSIRIPLMTRRRAIAGVAAAVVLAGGAIGWWQRQRSRNQPSPEGLQWYHTGGAALRDAAHYRAARALERSEIGRAHV